MNLTDHQFEQIIDVAQRGITAFESIAHSLAGINVSMQKFARKYAPEPRRQEDAREAVVSRVPTDEDRAKEAQGASNKPIGEWFDLDDNEEEEIGPREKQLREKQLRAQAEKESGSDGRRSEETGSDTTGSGESAADNAAI
jgi:hypothetical protein